MKQLHGLSHWTMAKLDSRGTAKPQHFAHLPTCLPYIFSGEGEPRRQKRLSLVTLPSIVDAWRLFLCPEGEIVPPPDRLLGIGNTSGAHKRVRSAVYSSSSRNSSSRASSYTGWLLPPPAFRSREPREHEGVFPLPPY